jgi:hypothetical protein
MSIEETDADLGDLGDVGDIVDIGDYHPAGSFERQLLDYKIKLAVTAVRENNGNKTLAARSLCISRAYLHRLIRLAEPDAADDQNLRDVETVWPAALQIGAVSELEHFSFCYKLPCPTHSAFFCGMGGIPTKFRSTQFPKML